MALNHTRGALRGNAAGAAALLATRLHLSTATA
jgi:hypothetical protein